MENTTPVRTCPSLYNAGRLGTCSWQVHIGYRQSFQRSYFPDSYPRVFFKVRRPYQETLSDLIRAFWYGVWNLTPILFEWSLVEFFLPMMRTGFWTTAIKWHLEQGEQLQCSTCAGGQIYLDWFSYLWIQTFLTAALELKLCFSCTQCGSQFPLDRNRVLVSVLKIKPSSYAKSVLDVGVSVWPQLIEHIVEDCLLASKLAVISDRAV